MGEQRLIKVEQMTKYTFDKQLELRNVAEGAETATAAETGLSLPVRMAGDFRAVFHVTALDTASGNETCALSIGTDSLVGFTDSPVNHRLLKASL